jgi:hypothetical protein
VAHFHTFIPSKKSILFEVFGDAFFMAAGSVKLGIKVEANGPHFHNRLGRWSR